MARSLVGPALALLLLLPATVRAEEETDPWLASLAAGKRAAAAADRLLFVYLDPSREGGAVGEAAEALSETALRAAAEDFVVVRLGAGREDAEGVAVRTRYGLFYSLAVGVVIDAEGICFGQLEGGSTDELLAVLGQAKQRARDYATKVAVLAGELDDTWLHQLATLHYEHFAFERAVAVSERLQEKGDLSTDELAWYAFGLARLGRLDDAERAYRLLLERGAGDSRMADMRIALATLRVCPTRVALLGLGREDPEIRQQGLDALYPLLEQVRAEHDVGGEASVRFYLLHFLEAYAEYVAQCTWIVENDPKGLHAADAWMRLVYLAAQWNDPALALRHARALIAALPADDELAAYAREHLVPAMEEAVVAAEDPELVPFELHATLGEEPPRPGAMATLAVRLVNRSERPFRDLGIGCHVAGPARLTAEATHVVERLGPQGEAEATFALELLESGTVHVVLVVQRLDGSEPTIGIGRHLRVDVTD